MSLDPGSSSTRYRIELQKEFARHHFLSHLARFSMCSQTHVEAPQVAVYSEHRPGTDVNARRTVPRPPRIDLSSAVGIFHPMPFSSCTSSLPSSPSKGQFRIVNPHLSTRLMF